MFDQQSYMREYRKVYMPEYRISHTEKFREYDRKRSYEAKLGAFNILGGPICTGCGETGIEFLTLGHVNGNGAYDRAENTRRKIYLEITRGIRDTNDYLVQCFNCNSGSNLESIYSSVPTSKHAFIGGICKICGRDKIERRSSHQKYGSRKRTECLFCIQKEKRFLREKVIDLFGGKCICCGEPRLTKLTIDHVNDDGNKKRSVDHCGTSYFYRKLLGDKIDQSLYQILCWNCNFSKYLGKGICFHRRKEEKNGV